MCFVAKYLIFMAIFRKTGKKCPGFLKLEWAGEVCVRALSVYLYKTMLRNGCGQELGDGHTDSFASCSSDPEKDVMRLLI